MENTTTRITTLEEHRKLLRRVFETARNRVLVVSPFITKSAIDQDRVSGLVRSATGRGVSVDIYTDLGLNSDGSGGLKSSAQSGVAALIRSGAHVTLVSGIHNKTLARDNDLIAEGSFNWLSAVRTSGGTHQREERTMLVEGEQAKEMINKEVTHLKKIGAGKELANDSAVRSRTFTKAAFWWFLASYGATFVCMPPPAGQSFAAWYLFLLVPCGTLAVVMAAAMSRKSTTEPTVMAAEKTSAQDAAAPDCSVIGVNSFGITPIDLTLGAGFDQIN